MDKVKVSMRKGMCGSLDLQLLQIKCKNIPLEKENLKQIHQIFKVITFCINLKEIITCTKFVMNCAFPPQAQMHTHTHTRATLLYTYVHKHMDTHMNRGSRIECDREVKND